MGRQGGELGGTTGALKTRGEIGCVTPRFSRAVAESLTFPVAQSVSADLTPRDLESFLSCLSFTQLFLSSHPVSKWPKLLTVFCRAVA